MKIMSEGLEVVKMLKVFGCFVDMGDSKKSPFVRYRKGRRV